MHDGHEALTRGERWRRLVQIVGGRRRAFFLQARVRFGQWLARRFGVRSRFTICVPLAGQKHVLYLRPTASDFRVFKQIICGDEYGWTRSLPRLGSVLDCGANVGFVSAMLLDRFPALRAVAVEPDRGTAAVCRMNLARFGGRATVVEAGVWSHACGLKAIDPGPAREWSVSVRQCEPGEAADVTAVSITQLLDEAGFDRVGLLKLDIEGAERVLFEADASWLDRVDHVAIELHDDACRTAFEHRMSAYAFERIKSGELDICLNLRRKGATEAPTA